MKINSDKELANKISLLLEENNITSPPVPIDLIAQKIGLKVRALQLEDDVSGLLVLKNGKGIIGFNQDHPSTRQRFSIAHEIGHFLLHKDSDDIFIDRHYIFRRDKLSSIGLYEREIEANRFAAEILMPATWIKSEIDGMHSEIDDESLLEYLSMKFQVSKQAMGLRIGQVSF